MQTGTKKHGLKPRLRAGLHFYVNAVRYSINFRKICQAEILSRLTNLRCIGSESVLKILCELPHLRMDDELAIRLVRVVQEIVLMVTLRWIEGCRRCYLGNNGRVPLP